MIYTGVFLDDKSKAALLSWWEDNFGPTLENTFAHHMTIKFRPSAIDIEDTPFGEAAQLKVVGYADDGKAQAVLVEPTIASSNEHPHITVATAPGTKPVHSNGMLAKGVRKVQGPTLTGIVKCFG